MTLGFEETKQLVDYVLKWDADDVRKRLHDHLNLRNRREGEFYAGIVEHRAGLQLSTEQWIEVVSRLPIELLRNQLELENILSEEQLRKLPPTTG